MSDYQQKDLTGSLFKNTRKESDQHADYNGSALVEGVEYWLDAWINTSNSGAKYMSLKLKPKNVAVGPIPRPPAPDIDDDIGF